MNVKICGVLLALALAVPTVSMATEPSFTGFSAGIIQDMGAEDDFKATSNGDDGVAQGGNVVVGNMAVDIVQLAGVGDDLKLTMNGSEHSSQGLNVIQGKTAAFALQVGYVGDDVKMVSNGNEDSAQGVNVINSCEGCDEHNGG